MAVNDLPHTFGKRCIAVVELNSLLYIFHLTDGAVDLRLHHRLPMQHVQQCQQQQCGYNDECYYQQVAVNTYVVQVGFCQFVHHLHCFQVVCAQLELPEQQRCHGGVHHCSLNHRVAHERRA